VRPRLRVLAEQDGSVGTVCVYQAASPEAIREHAKRADLPVDEIIPVADTVIVLEALAERRGMATGPESNLLPG